MRLRPQGNSNRLLSGCQTRIRSCAIGFTGGGIIGVGFQIRSWRRPDSKKQDYLERRFGATMDGHGAFMLLVRPARTAAMIAFHIPSEQTANVSCHIAMAVWSFGAYRRGTASREIPFHISASEQLEMLCCQDENCG